MMKPIQKRIEKFVITQKIRRAKIVMAGSVNKVILIGNLGNDPDVKTMSSGGRLCNLSIATSESWKDKATGERREKTEWHRVVIFNDALVGIAESYLKKGSKVYIEGQMETRKWTDQTGADKYTTEVVLRPYRGELNMLDSRNSQGSQQSGGYNQSAPAQMTGNGGQVATANQATAPVDDFEDEIPF